MHRIIGISLASLLFVAPALAQEAQGTFVDQAGGQAGTVTLTQVDGAVTVSGEAMGLTPGEHGIHFHMSGECNSADKFESAGGHFNPGDHQHGLENPAGAHAGDLPNVTAADDGIATFDLDTDRISLVEGEVGYVFDADGTALVIHADADDQMTDPSGKSGDRVLCAVIEAMPAS